MRIARFCYLCGRPTTRPGLVDICMSHGELWRLERAAVCVDALITDPLTGTILMIRRAMEPRIGEWSLPGGHIDEGETAEQAMCREAREETGLVITDCTYLGSVIDDIPDDPRLILVFGCVPHGSVTVSPDEVSDWGWFSESPSPVVECIRTFLPFKGEP